MCVKGIILDRFRNNKEHWEFTENAVEGISQRREEDEEFAKALLE